MAIMIMPPIKPQNAMFWIVRLRKKMNVMIRLA